MRLETKRMWHCNNSAWLNCQMGRTVSTAWLTQSGEAFVALHGVKLNIVPRLLRQTTWGPGADFAGWFCLFIWGYKNPDLVNVHGRAGRTMSPVEDGSDSTMAGSDNASPLFISCQLRKTVKCVLSQNWENVKLRRNNVWWHVLVIHLNLSGMLFFWWCDGAFTTAFQSLGHQRWPLLLNVWQILVIRWEFKVMQIRDGMDFWRLCCKSFLSACLKCYKSEFK